MPKAKRLNKQFNPNHYKLNLKLDAKAKTFSGQLIITGTRQSAPSKRITLHQSGLKIKEAKIFKLEKNSEEQELKLSRTVHHETLQELRLHTEQNITSGSYRIELSYEGKIPTKGTSGIYTSFWQQDSKSPKQEIITTQFEPHYARTMLPCIDEPEAKAVFELSLELAQAPKSVLFNTPIASQNNQTYHFEPTPKMSTYLLALIIGTFESKSLQHKDLTISVFATPNKIESTDFALSLAKRAVQFFEEHFGVPYPLKKLDLVAIPDFDAGGMENWGLITFREDYLLFDESLATLSDRQAVALTVVHEVAHQWFGNLVTMKWWDELWLNEGFANFMEYYAVNELFPEWNIMESYVAVEKNSAIRLDSMPSSRAIIKKVTSPHHAVEIFDSIAYEKSGNIIRMILSLIGKEAFFEGLKDYFQKYSYKNANSEDLLNAWQKRSKLNISALARTWLTQPGLPVLEVSLGKNPKQINLRQERLLFEDSKLNPKKEAELLLSKRTDLKRKQREFYKNYLTNKFSKKTEYLWHIPINFVPPTKQKSSNFIMKKKLHKIQLPKEQNLPIKLNVNGDAFYVANYSVEFLAQISQSIQTNSLNNLDLLNLLSDFISLNRAGLFEHGSGAILELLLASKNYRSSNFWGLVGTYTSYVHHHLKYEGQEEQIYSYINSLIESRLQELGLKFSKEDPPEDTSTRSELLSLAALAKHPATMNQLLKLYESSNGIISKAEPELRSLILYAIAKRGHKKDYQNIFKQYQENIEDVSLRDDLAYCLCMFEEEEFIKLNLENMQNPELVRSQDILLWFSQLSATSLNSCKSLIDWLKNKGGWNWLSENLSEMDLSYSVKIILATCFTKPQLNSLKKFFSAQNMPAIEKALNESSDMATSRILWHKNELPRAIKYLKNHQ